MDTTKVLAGLPGGLREELLKCYREIAANYAEHRWEPSELNGGKFCEVVYSIINGCIHGSFPAKASKPASMVKACGDLEKVPQDPNRMGDRSLRVLIPRMLPALYEIRNNRGVGHVGGDVDPNFLDATAVYEIASWILAELVRIFHGVSTREAQETVDLLIERKLSLVWDVEGLRRVLDPTMSKSNQTLLLLMQKPAWVLESDLVNWVEYSSLRMFRTRILEPLHDARLIEYDRRQRRVRISPLGIRQVEQEVLKSYSS